MAGRKQFDVQAALTSAMETFWEHGYSGASLSMLTEATGLGRGSLYGTFGNKESLFRACLQRYAETYRGDYESALEEQDPVEGIRAFYQSLIVRMLDPRVPGGCLVAQSASLATALDPRGQAAVAAMLEEQRVSVTRALEHAGVPPARGRALAEYVVAVRQSLAVLHRAGSGEEELRRVADLACDTVSAAIAGQTGVETVSTSPGLSSPRPSAE